jgi:hypothetical protein
VRCSAAANTVAVLSDNAAAVGRHSGVVVRRAASGHTVRAMAAAKASNAIVRNPRSSA